MDRDGNIATPTTGGTVGLVGSAMVDFVEGARGALAVLHTVWSIVLVWEEEAVLVLVCMALLICVLASSDDAGCRLGEAEGG